MKHLLVVIILSFCSVCFSQIKGTIVDDEGNPLSYATIYVAGTSTGTISNIDGQYSLDLPSNNTYTIVYQYVGYQKQELKVFYLGGQITKDIRLSLDENLLQELVISVDQEDPAYGIIRKAIQKRQFHKNQVPSFRADLYVKGVVKIIDAPKKVLGEEVGNLNGFLDSTRQGIIYLSESKSEFYFQAPNQNKEIMISSIKSGENDLFTANQFSLASFDLYDEYLQFGRSIISPIADNAFKYYKYALEKTIVDQNGLMVNKIKIIPRSSTDPLLSGYIYIVDDLWNIHSVDVAFSGNSLKSTFLDTIILKQVFIPIENKDTWRLFSQVISFKAGLFGFKMGGNFSYIFSNYDLHQDLTSVFTNNETFRVEESALNRDTSYWSKIRPIPLTIEEAKDYTKKDSLVKIWSTKAFMDSLDKANNKVQISNFFLGYTWNNTFKKQSYTYPKPFSTLRFNAIEGFKLNIDSYWSWSDSTFRSVTVRPILHYGFADKLLKPSIEWQYVFDNKRLGSVYGTIGRRNIQFDDQEPIGEFSNTWNSLIFGVNSIKMYQNNVALLGYKQELVNGLFIDITTQYSHRNPVTVNTQYKFRHKDLLYEENTPRNDFGQEYYSSNSYFKNTLSVLIKPYQKYSSYPNMKIRDASDWPNILLDYQMGIAVDKQSNHFHRLKIRVSDSYVNANLLGYFNYNIEFGTFLGSSPSYFSDFFHASGSELLLKIAPGLASFNLMPFYKYSTNKYYTSFNYRHHFNGYVMDKIPLLNRTSIKWVVALSAIYEPIHGQYAEAIIGLENFKIGPLSLFTLDYTWSYDREGYFDRGLTIRLTALFE